MTPAMELVSDVPFLLIRPFQKMGLIFRKKAHERGLFDFEKEGVFMFQKST